MLSTPEAKDAGAVLCSISLSLYYAHVFDTGFATLSQSQICKQNVHRFDTYPSLLSSM